MSAEPICSCPSGDGSLRWPCLAHPSAQAEQRGNVVIAGDEIFAGIDEDDVEATGPITWAIVVKFPNEHAMRAALRACACSFTVFESEEAAG